MYMPLDVGFVDAVDVEVGDVEPVPIPVAVIADSLVRAALGVFVGDALAVGVGSAVEPVGGLGAEGADVDEWPCVVTACVGVVTASGVRPA